MHPSLVLKKMEYIIEAIMICKALSGIRGAYLLLIALNLGVSTLIYQYLSAHKNDF